MPVRISAEEGLSPGVNMCANSISHRPSPSDETINRGPRHRPVCVANRIAQSSRHPVHKVFGQLDYNLNIYLFCISAAFASESVLLRQVCLGLTLPTLRLPWGFQSSAWRVMFVDGLHNVWPIHPHFLFLMSTSIGSWLVSVHRSLFEMT